MRIARHDINSPLTALAFFVFSLFTRLVWWRFGSSFVWPDIYIHPDSWQFVNAATNLISTGTYTADPGFRDGLFTRVPGYTLIWALLHLIEEDPYVLMSVFQATLDSFSTLLIIKITKKLSKSIVAALIAGILYATYPFALFWITPAVPDVFTTFAALGVIWLTLTVKLNAWGALTVGFSCAMAVLIREYLLVLPIAYAARLLPLTKHAWIESAKLSFIALLAFVVAYSPWPLRNLINHGELILLRAETSGSRHYDRDVMGLVGWASLWSDDVNPVLMKILDGEQFETPQWVWRDENHRQASFDFMFWAADCGEGLRQWKSGSAELSEPCTDQAADGFTQMREELSSREPFNVWTVVPMRNVAKAIFKSELVNMPSSPTKVILVKLLFGWRTLLILLGFVGVFLSRNHLSTWIVLAPALAIYFTLTVILRGLQMRYLLQADVILLIFASIALENALRHVIPSWADRVNEETT